MAGYYLPLFKCFSFHHHTSALTFPVYLILSRFFCSYWNTVETSKYTKIHKSIQKFSVSTVSSPTAPHGDPVRVSSKLHKQTQLQSSCHAVPPTGVLLFMSMDRHFSPSLITHQCSQYLPPAARSHRPGHQLKGRNGDG